MSHFLLENEISPDATLVYPALVKGRIISNDTIPRQKKWCVYVHRYCSYYLIIVKLNQPQMCQDLLVDFTGVDAQAVLR